MTAEICRHETFKDICAICHSNNVIDKQAAEIERLRAVLEVLTSNIEHAFPNLSHLGPVKNARAELAKEKQP
jgi:hypothetical protein